MKLGDLKQIIKLLPNKFGTKILYGNSELAIVQTTVGADELIITVEEKRDLSDNEKHEDPA